MVHSSVLTPGWSTEERKRLEDDAVKSRPFSTKLTSSHDIGKKRFEGAKEHGQRITGECVLRYQSRLYHEAIGETLHCEQAKLAQLQNPDTHAGLKSKASCSNPAYENRLAQILLVRHEECRRKRQERELAQKQLQTAKMQAELMAMFTECKKSGSVISPVATPMHSPLAMVRPARVEITQNANHPRAWIARAVESLNVQDSFHRLLLEHTGLSPECVLQKSPAHGSEYVKKKPPQTPSLDGSDDVRPMTGNILSRSVQCHCHCAALSEWPCMSVPSPTLGGSHYFSVSSQEVLNIVASAASARARANACAAGATTRVTTNNSSSTCKECAAGIHISLHRLVQQVYIRLYIDRSAAQVALLLVQKYKYSICLLY